MRGQGGDEMSIVHRGKTHWIRPHEWSGWFEMAVDDEHYVFPCPHCMPSYFLYKPEIMIHEVCVNMGSKRCKECYEPECEFSQILGDEDAEKVC